MSHRLQEQDKSNQHKYLYSFARTSNARGFRGSPLLGTASEKLSAFPQMACIEHPACMRLHLCQPRKQFATGEPKSTGKLDS
jgi:hypothetical protein